MANTEAAKLRLEDAELAAEQTRRQPPGGQGCPCLLVETATQTTYPTTAGTFFHCKIVSVLGTEAEGMVATYTVVGGTIQALHLGATVPPVGTKLLAFFVPFRWCFRFP